MAEERGDASVRIQRCRCSCPPANSASEELWAHLTVELTSSIRPCSDVDSDPAWLLHRASIQLITVRKQVSGLLPSDWAVSSSRCSSGWTAHVIMLAVQMSLPAIMCAIPSPCQVATVLPQPPIPSERSTHHKTPSVSRASPTAYAAVCSDLRPSSSLVLWLLCWHCAEWLS